MRKPFLLFLFGASILGCSVYQSNARKNFETRSPSYVVSFSSGNCQPTQAPTSFQDYTKSVNEFGQVQITQTIPYQNAWYSCSEIYDSEQAWQEHQNKFMQTETDEDSFQLEGTQL